MHFSSAPYLERVLFVIHTLYSGLSRAHRYSLQIQVLRSDERRRGKQASAEYVDIPDSENTHVLCGYVRKALLLQIFSQRTENTYVNSFLAMFSAYK
jgi:hypothetical protein